ncbi:hypothetical protein C4J81_00465 [Deltaproteobacteria bacterium Smac51]|nr:hypothetical protein C4J81_00465 [Deltaproteobacteria bacterium Smac51]
MMNKICMFALTALAMAVMLAAPGRSQAQDEAEKTPPTEIQKTIDLLEDETKRTDVVRLLKLMAVMDEEVSADQSSASPDDQAADSAAAEQARGLKNYLQGKVEQAWRTVGVSGIGFRQSIKAFSEVMKTLVSPEHFEMWRPYVLKVCLWGLVCLLAAWVIIKKFGAPPEYNPDLRGRLKAALRYILVVAVPSLMLALSLLALPGLSTTAPGVTSTLATGFEFIHSLVQHFFVNLSILYIVLRLAMALFTPNREGHSLIDVHPVLSRHFLHSTKVVATYLAVFVFIKEVFLVHFVVGALYSFCLVLMTIPVPIYLTFRILKLKRLLHTIGEAEASASLDEEEDTTETADGQPASSLEYRANGFIRRHWPTILIAFVWLMEIIAIFNPADATERFVGRLIGTLTIIFLAGLTIIIERRLMIRFVKHDTENGRHLLLLTDAVSNVIVWLGALGMLVSLWGMPLENILTNALTREILGRAFAIVVTIITLAVFLRFSSLATDWLMSSRELNDSRNMRTMLPLILTAVRALAVFIGVVVILERLGVNVGPILAGAGILSLGVGMGAQTLVKDVINGISILLMNTISVGDYVTMGGQSGTVEFLGLRTARLRDSSGNLIIVPNSSVTSIVNMTRDYSQELVELPVPYDADPDEMLKLVREVADGFSSDPVWKSSMTSPVEVVGITAFDANTTTIRLRINARAGSQWSLGRELRLRLKRRTLSEGLKSPWFGQNVFLYKGDDNYNAHRCTGETGECEAPVQNQGNENTPDDKK